MRKARAIPGRRVAMALGTFTESIMEALSIRLDKLEVAERQLCEAIRLFFERRDPVAIHTLTAAAHAVLHDLGKKNGTRSMLKDLAPIREEKRKEWDRLLNAAQNFFKHADRDPKECYDFHYEASKFYMLDAVDMLLALTRSIPKEAFVFRIWICAKHPEFFDDQALRGLFEGVAVLLGPAIDSFENILLALDDPCIPDRIPLGSA